MATVKKVKKAQDGAKSKSDTTKISKPYKVSADEPYLKGYVYPGADSTGKKMRYNAKVVAPEMIKRNEERKKEGKAPISYKSITGSDVIPFSNKGKSYKEAPTKQKSGGVTKAKAGKQMIKRADGSTSQRGLWDNIRAAKGSGKKPTAQMLKQEKKIKSQTKKK
jgi:hypothetical protein